MLELDHLVVACLDLDEGEARLHARLGTALAPGGRHPGWSTHNRLLQLGGGAYLELIAPDPSQPAPTGPRPFGLDEPAMRERLGHGPALVHWVVRADDLDRERDALRYAPGAVHPMTRDALRWRITLPADGRPAAGGLLPTLIAWDVPPQQHPAARLPAAGVRLARLEIGATPDVLALRPRVAAAVPVEWVERDPAAVGLVATLDTPAGRIVLR